ncbi:hypothetical protein COY23_00240 [bacterium (Candidatus Torokbacteria) CG_4_10_14_0_2_um_filter_35_8]|nr:MAG: hypothetical protein COY23_00240 [bacterium (Candidatus Torokbacteria) CG_4_10_14_0_2_um_filter_35_8]
MDILKKLEKEKLTGRGGADFPTHLKWKIVNKAKDKDKYVICNVSEGEPDVEKDRFVLENYQKEMVSGIKIAIDFLEAKEGFIYLRNDYYSKFSLQLKYWISDYPIKLVREEAGYIGGEETALIEFLEGKRAEPRVRPPFPPTCGLFGKPTLINNAETFYCVDLINRGIFKHTRLYTINGDVENPGVYGLDEDVTVKDALKETKNLPKRKFFVQVGGGAAGEVLGKNQLNVKVCGSGAIIVYDARKTDIKSLLKKWIEFFMKESCGKCVPCREGIFRIYELLQKPNTDLKLISDIVYSLEQSSFCGLGRGCALSISSLFVNVLRKSKAGEVIL